jgi:SAM-dependent methyltransferase
MLPAALERITEALPADARVLDVGGAAAAFTRADAVIDALPYAQRSVVATYGSGAERFSARTWVQRDLCDRAPWPYADGAFDLVVCVGVLQELRDPVWVCSEMARVARGGYVEVPTPEATLAVGEEGRPLREARSHRWLCELRGGELVFTARPHGVEADWSLRVTPRQRERLEADGELQQGLFWEGRLPAHERLLVGAEGEAALEDLRARLRERLDLSPAEVRVQQARDVARQGLQAARQPVVRAAGQALGRLGRRGS